MVWYGVVWFGVVWCGMVRFGVMWCSMIWYGVVCVSTLFSFCLNKFNICSTHPVNAGCFLIRHSLFGFSHLLARKTPQTLPISYDTPATLYPPPPL